MPINQNVNMYTHNLSSQCIHCTLLWGGGSIPKPCNPSSVKPMWDFFPLFFNLLTFTAPSNSIPYTWHVWLKCHNTVPSPPREGLQPNGMHLALQPANRSQQTHLFFLLACTFKDNIWFNTRFHTWGLVRTANKDVILGDAALAEFNF